MITFGPVPSRRLGHSLGINNIPPKICTYSCVYCQLGNTYNMKIKIQKFYQPSQIFHEVEEKIDRSKEKIEEIDYLTFVPDGEPTLDINLGKEIQLLKSLGIKIAVISNASLLAQEQVRENLKKADLVSLKIDSTEMDTWRKINRPHRNLELGAILEGILEFTKSFTGEIITETMLVKDVNDSRQNIEKVGRFLGKLKPEISYLSLPTRPPAEKWVQYPSEEVVNQSYNIFKEQVAHVEYLIGYEGNAFAFTGNAEEDILSITSVHPMREEALKDFLGRANCDWLTVSKLIKESKLLETEYKGNKYYLRKFSRSTK
jgi:wyosine [tRNA(Phe)-imidazoG37] synthetase (radical SAM superfamily)